MCYAHVIRNCRKRPFSSNNNKKLNFKKEWLGAHCNWFEGAAIYTASTNNGQEGHNAVIKRKITLRRRLPMNEFLRCMAQMARDVSTQFSKNRISIRNYLDLQLKWLHRISNHSRPNSNQTRRFCYFRFRPAHALICPNNITRFSFRA